MASAKRPDYIDTNGGLRVHRRDKPSECRRKIAEMLGSRMASGERYTSGKARMWSEAREVHDLRPMDDPRTVN